MPARVLLLMLVLAYGPAPAGERVDYGAAIDQVGRLRMLSQRIVKAYCQIGLAVRKEDAAAQLAGSVREFERAMVAVRRLAAPAAAGDAIGRLEDAWLPFRALATGPVSREDAVQLDQHGERLLEAAQGLVLRLERHSGRPESRLVNLAGRQRMLTQRLAKVHLLRLYGIDSPALRAQSLEARKDFYAAHSTLESAGENTPALRRELQAVAVQWEWLRNALAAESTQNYAHGVAAASERILERMERITALYARRAGTALY